MSSSYTSPAGNPPPPSYGAVYDQASYIMNTPGYPLSQHLQQQSMMQPQPNKTSASALNNVNFSTSPAYLQSYHGTAYYLPPTGYMSSTHSAVGVGVGPTSGPTSTQGPVPASKPPLYVLSGTQGPSQGVGPQYGLEGSRPALGPGPGSSGITTVPHTPIPPVPKSFPELENLSIDRLMQLQNDEPSLKTQVRNHPTVVEFVAEKDKLMQENVALARENVSQHQRYLGCQEEVARLQHTMHAELEQYKARVEAVGQRQSPSELREKMVQRNKSTNELSEQYAKAFLDGRMPLEEFLKSYQEARMKYHVLDLELKALR